MDKPKPLRISIEIEAIFRVRMVDPQFVEELLTQSFEPDKSARIRKILDSATYDGNFIRLPHNCTDIVFVDAPTTNGNPDYEDELWRKFVANFQDWLKSTCETIMTDWIDDVSIYVARELLSFKDLLFFDICEGKIQWIYDDGAKAEANFDDFYRGWFYDHKGYYPGEEEPKIDDDDDDDLPLRQWYLPFFDPYIPLRAKCMACFEPAVFSGYMSVSTSQGHKDQDQYQCQGCGLLRYAGSDLPSVEGVRVALEEPCACGGQFRRDKNIFCPACGNRKRAENRREDYLTVAASVMDALQEQHGEPMTD